MVMLYYLLFRWDTWKHGDTFYHTFQIHAGSSDLHLSSNVMEVSKQESKMSPFEQELVEYLVLSGPSA